MNIRQQAPLWRPEFEHDSCGMGFVAQIYGERSHSIVRDALTALVRMQHRGGSGADADTGDGAGILTQIPDAYLRTQVDFTLPEEGKYAVAQIFLPREESSCTVCQNKVAEVIGQSKHTLLGWREVPVNLYACGSGARISMPAFRQAFIGLGCSEEDAEREMYILRRMLENAVDTISSEFYIASLSTKTIIYKGMLHSDQLEDFFPELKDKLFKSAFALIHSRFSTNTMPSWSKAQPCRMIAHNGEINTLRGTEMSIGAAQSSIRGGKLHGRTKEIFPIITSAGSDSMKFDNTLEFFVHSGRNIEQALMMMIPGAWSQDPSMSPELKAFYEYSACLTPPWDGPASIAFTDGTKIGAVLDRNGLRPARWILTIDGRLLAASESGVLDIKPSQIYRRGKLGPGEMIVLDTSTGEVREDAQVKKANAQGEYANWLEKNRLLIGRKQGGQFAGDLAWVKAVFGYTHEELMSTLAPMAQAGGDPLGAMGFDAPLAVLSQKPQLLYNFFKQLFAQVTNPPIDAIRESCVTGTELHLGEVGDITQDSERNARTIRLEHPILDCEQFHWLMTEKHGFNVAVIPMTFDPAAGLEAGLESMFQAAKQAIADGSEILVLSDRTVDDTHLPIPALLGAAGVHHVLVRAGIRGKCSLVVDSAEPREVHHFACLVGFGVKGIHPYGAISCIRNLVSTGILAMDEEKAVHNYVHAVEHGLLKIISKMGISCITGYFGAQVFEAVGISQEVVNQYFTGTITRMGGMTIKEIEADLVKNYTAAKKSVGKQLRSGGVFQWKRDGEEHLYSPQVIHTFQTAVRNGDYKLYKEYSAMMTDEAKTFTLRSLLAFQDGKPVAIEEVEPVENIVKRFKTGAMSYGSLSKEAHECLAIAMNRLGGKSNSGEGGEDEDRLFNERNSAIKQVASGRFGVTGRYLASAKEIQIKMAQGAKPGEGGQLPGNKVYPWVAKTRHSTPGVGLISPPPHHDIYSIEDLAQLIFDLKASNPAARINVKLVSETGVGTVAAGVAKGGADVILISGYDGGTGASPRTSIQHAGLPWEIGLAETHQILTANGLRGRVRVEVDGKLMTGRDVAIAALLGAEEFGFATLPLVAVGCVMMRVCNLDTCPVGVATQNVKLRARFAGKPEYVENTMRFIAQELREIMAELGFRTIDEMVGHANMLKQRIAPEKAKGLDLSPLTTADLPLPWRDSISKGVDESLFYDMVGQLALSGGAEVKRKIQNTERAVGTRVGAFVSRRYGKLPKGRLKFQFHGTAGQSFGAFIPEGIELTLIGDANDYVGKGLSGGRIIVRAPGDAGWSERDNILVGNVTLYGATGGEFFLAGRAGERFCVRNSGAVAVCEGVGDHGCEYMTGGVAVILGSVGRNFAAGMSGGVAYILDDGTFEDKCNKEMVDIYPLGGMDVVTVYTLISKHAELTGSHKARQIVDKWSNYTDKFKKVIAHDYKLVLEAMEQAEAEGYCGQDRVDRAFEIKTKGGK